MSIPVLPLYAQADFGLSAFQVGTLTSLYFAAQFLAAPFLGRLSDRIGRRPVLLGSQLGTLTAAIITALAGLPTHLYLSRLVDGLTGGNISVAQAYMADISEEKDRARSLGLIFAAFGLGFLIGPAFGAYASHAFGPRVTFGCVALASCVTMMLTYFVLPESLTAERRARIAAEAAVRPASAVHPLALRQVQLLLAVNFLGQLAAFTLNQVFILWARDVVAPEWSVDVLQRRMTLVFVIAGLAAILSQAALIKPLVKNLGEAATVVFGSALRMAGYAVMALFPRIVPATVGSALTSIGAGVAMPCSSALLTFATRGIPRGRVIGLSQSAVSLGNIMGPLLGGLVFDWNPKAPPSVAACILLVALFVSFGLKTPPPEPIDGSFPPAGVPAS